MGAYVYRIEDSGNYTYLGRAQCGSGEDQAVWFVRRFDRTSGTVIQLANGRENPDQAWANRAALTYR